MKSVFTALFIFAAILSAGVVNAEETNNKIVNAESAALLEQLKGKGGVEMISDLLQKGVNATLKDDKVATLLNGQDMILTAGSTPIMIAAAFGYSDMVEQLLKDGADISVKNEGGMTAIIFAAISGDTATVKLLLDKNADISVKNAYGISSLMYAANAGSSETVKLLIDHKAQLNEKNSNGITPLMYASHIGSTECMKVLIDSGADIHAKDENGLTALNYAMINDSKDAIELLKQAIKAKPAKK